jgi:hypothetical protein
MASSAHHAYWIREETAMTATTFNAAHQKAQVRKQIEAALAAYREMLDTFVSGQMRQTAAEAEHARPRQTPGTRSPSKDA